MIIRMAVVSLPREQILQTTVSPTFFECSKAYDLVFNPVFEPVYDASGLVSAGRSFEIPGIVNFNGIAYNTSTAGTLPVVLNKAKTHGFDTPSGLYGHFWRGGIVPSHTQVQGRYPQPSGFNTNYTVTQQGFTATVSCQAQNPFTAFPSLTVSSKVIYGGSVRVGNLSLWETHTNCVPGDTQLGEFRRQIHTPELLPIFNSCRGHRSREFDYS